MYNDHPPPYELSHAEYQRPTASAYDRTPRPSLYEPAFIQRRVQLTTESPPKIKSSLDFTQRIERKLAKYNASDNPFKRWLFEILCWLASALAMGAIVGIYSYLNDKPIAQAGELLTYANALGKVASAALIVPTSEALGQLKWNWFQKSNAMWDFEIFDKASRGPVGATLLLFRTKGRSLAALGALLIVLLLAIDTFFQQVVEYPDRWALQNTTGAIPRVVEYIPDYSPAYRWGVETSPIDVNLAPIVKTHLYNNGTQPIAFGNGSRPDIPLSCPTNKCTWPAYETLAVCSNCVDVSDSLDLSFACVNTTIDWTATWFGPLLDEPYPNGTVCGYFLNATSATPTLVSGYTFPSNATNHTVTEALLVRALPLTKFMTKERLYNTGSIHFKSIRNPIMDFLLASAPNGTGSVYRRERPLVHECLLSWCIQTLTSSYDSGRYHEVVEAVYQNTTAGPSPWTSFEMPGVDGGGTWVQYTENITITHSVIDSDSMWLNSTNSKFGLNNVTAGLVMAQFDDFFPSYYTSLSDSAVPQLRHKEYSNGPTTMALPFNAWLAPNNLTRHMERFATALTNVIRSSPSQKMLLGSAYQKENYIKIRWGWLSFPFVLLVLTLVFLVSTIIKTSGDSLTGLWKNSAMPTLIYSLPKETQGHFASSSTWSKDQGAPKKTRIRLLPNMGWRVSGHNYQSRSPRLPSGERVPHGWI